MIPELVQRAMTETITSIGQLTPADRRLLDRYVKRGYLSKGKGGSFPIIKTVYACPGFDFAEHRRRHVEHMARLAELDRAILAARRGRR